MPGLLRGMARTAVIAGTATSVSNRVSRRQGQRSAMPDFLGFRIERELGRGAMAVVYLATQLSLKRSVALKDLADLKQQGVLTEEEFAAEKARILAS